MAHNVETMAWTNEEPWHGLGERVDGNLTPKEMAKAARIDWTVSKRELWMGGGEDSDGSLLRVPGNYALVRDTDNRVLSPSVSEGYKPFQNLEVIEFFDKFVKAGDMTMETAGSLRNGQFIWALSKLKSDFELPGGDKVNGYLLLMSPHKVGFGLWIQFTPIRVVCNNTLSLALGFNLDSKQGMSVAAQQKGVFRFPHLSEFDGQAKRMAEEALGLSTNQMSEFRAAAAVLASAPANEEEIRDYLLDVFGVRRAIEEGVQKREPKAITHVMEALEKAPGADLKSARGTWWGAVNAVTYAIDHTLGANRDSRMSSAWFGERSTYKRRALSLALEKAGALN